MNKFDRILEALSLVTAQRHKSALAQAQRQREEELRKAKESVANTLRAEVQSAYQQGYAAGKEFEQQALAKKMREAREEAARKQREAAIERAKWLVSAEPIGFDSRICDEFKADVSARMAYPPQPDQWKMIFANDPATYVIAGAGSGKSSSLVLRVIALNLYLGIDRSRISVFTFTKDSRIDFIKKLRAAMAKWDIDLPETDAKGIVRTFHSMVLKMARESMRPAPKILELLDRERKGPVRDIDVDNLLELSEKDDAVEEGESLESAAGDDEKMVPDDEENSDTVDELLRLAYERALKDSDAFYALVLKLFKLSFTQTRRATDKHTKGNIARTAKVDQQMTEALDFIWRTKIAPGLWPLDDIESGTRSICVSSQIAQEFWVNGYVPQIGAHLVLGGAHLLKDAASEDLPSRAAINTKRKLLAGISEKPLIWIDSVDQLTELRSTLKWLADHQEKRAEVLMFKMIAPGEFKATAVVKGFYGLAQFVENLGLPVAETLASAQASKQNNLRHDAIFMHATALFWPYFEAVLKEKGMATFNQLFAHFSEDRPANFDAVPSHVLGAMRHLLIDEFQDVSPQIVKWIRGCQKALVKRDMAGSLTCVGDDWQSIYGWRGSSPEFFVKFKEHFPAISHGKILLEDNFRSSDHILRCAESVLAGVPGMEKKTCRAKGRWATAPVPVRIYEVKKELPYADIRQHISSEIVRTQASDKHPMLVLSRSKRAHLPLSKFPTRSWGSAVKFMTFHGAKGLESQSVVLLGDCYYAGTNPVKNFLYEKAGLGNYDEAQRAESRRVAYVGITRAMESCAWYGVKQDNGAIGSIPKGAAFATSSGEKYPA